MKTNPKLVRFAWALYDFANTIFAVNILGLYFFIWLSLGQDYSRPDYLFVLGSSLFLAGLLMPIAGEIQDTLKKRVPFLVGFTLGSVAFSVLLCITQSIPLALICFGLANFCYQLGAMVYHSLLAQVSRPQTLGRTSGLGAGLGYLGAVLGLNFVRPFFETYGIKAAFFLSAVWFLLLALPALVLVKDLPHPYIPKIQMRRKAVFSRLRKTLQQIQRDKPLSKFLFSSFFYLNAANTMVIFTGVYAQRVLNLGNIETIYLYSLSAIFAAAGAYGGGFLVDNWGAKNTLNLGFRLWCLTIFSAAITINHRMLWLVGPAAGICLGATWAAARPMLIELAPEEKIGQLFGLFGLTEKLSFLIGPIVWGIITIWAFAGWGVFKYRAAMVAVFVCMFKGYLLFQEVEEPRKLTA